MGEEGRENVWGGGRNALLLTIISAKKDSFVLLSLCKVATQQLLLAPHCIVLIPSGYEFAAWPGT